MRTAELHWLAGILEGEGYFAYPPAIRLSMTDKDVVSQVAGLLDRSVVMRKAPTVTGKRVYSVSLCGQPAINLMKKLYNLLGSRRRKKIDKILGISKTSSRYKLTERDMKVIRKLYSTGKYSHRQLASRFNVSKHPIVLVLKYPARKPRSLFTV